MAQDPTFTTLPRTIFTDQDPFGQAAGFTTQSNEFIQTQIDQITDIVGDNGSGTLGAALDTISALQAIGDNMTLPEYNVTPPLLTPEIDVEINFPDIDPRFWGTVDSFDLGDPETGPTIPTIGTVTVPGFDPTPFNIMIPEAPAPTSISDPSDVPTAPVINMPVSPVITLPDAPQMVDVVIPPFSVPTLEDFEATFPVFEGLTDINTMLNWDDIEYDKIVVDERIFSSIEDGLFARGRDREDREVLKQENQATGEWASKGFTAPPGMLVKRLDSIREEGLLKKLSLNREMIIKFHQDDIDNWRFVVQQGLVAEGMYVQVLLASSAHMFEVQRINLESQVQIQGLLIEVFKASLEEVKVRASVYETQVRAKMMDIEVFKALIEGEKAKAQVNESLVRAYATEVSVRETFIRLYSEQLKAVGVQVDIFNSEINAHKGEVDVYVAKVDADKNRFDAYASQIRGEAIKPDILAAEARAYTSEVEALKIGVDAEVAALQGAVATKDQLVRTYEARVRGLLGKAQTQLAEIEANVQGNAANTQRYIARVTNEEVHDKVQLAAWEGTNRTNLDIFKADIAAFQAKLETAVKQVDLLISSQTAAGQLSSTIVAGALSAAHVGATLSSQSGVSASGSIGYSSSAAESVSMNSSRGTSVTYQATQPSELDFYPVGFGTPSHRNDPDF